MIELVKAGKIFTDPAGRSVAAVTDVSLRIEAGETVCLLGTSGCGKTTTLRLINRLLDLTSGQVLVDGRDVQEHDVITLRRQIGYVVQSGGLFPHQTVAGNIGLLCRLEGWQRSAIDRRVHELLELVNLPAAEFAHRYPRELSGGQRQRIGVARALALDPAYVLMDEPFGALDPLTRRQLHQEFLQLQAKVGKTVVLVTHDLAEAFALGQRVALMNGGRLVQVGSAAELRDRPAEPFVTEFLRSHSPAGEAS